MDFTSNELLSTTSQQLWETLPLSDPTVICNVDLGTTVYQATGREIMLSSYYWDMLRGHPNAVIQPDHFVSHHYTQGRFGADTDRSTLNAVLWYVIDLTQTRTRVGISELTRQAMQIHGAIYNRFISVTEADVTSIDIVDFIAVENLPEVKGAITDMARTGAAITYAYDAINNVFADETSVNPVVLAAQSGVVNKNQILQCLGPRGKVTELDSTIITIPVTRSFCQGMGNLYNLATESRSGAKALYMSDVALKQSEFFARRLQMITMSVETLYDGDCGSTKYHNWTLKGPEQATSNTPARRGDLEFMQGKYYMDPEDNVLKVLTKQDTHLYGRVVKLRAVSKCNHPDPHGVCSVCFGRLWESVPPNCNLGHFSSAFLTQLITQILLSTKHLDANSSGEKVFLDDITGKYFAIGRDNCTFRLKITRSVKLHVRQVDIKDLRFIFDMEDIKDVNPSRLCRLDTIRMEQDGVIQEVIIQQTDRLAMFTPELIEYIRVNDMTHHLNGYYIIDLNDWNKSLPILRLPSVEYNYSAHGSNISALIESKAPKGGASRANTYQNRPSVSLVSLFDLVNSKLNVNLALLEVIIYGVTAVDPVGGNLGLSRGHDDAVMYNGERLIGGRSMSPALAFKDVSSKLTSPASYIPGHRPDHPFDVFLTPHQTVEAYK